MRFVRWSALASFAVSTMCGGSSAAAGPSPNPGPSVTGAVSCTASQAAAFAWWVGTWNYSVPGFDPGTTTVTPTNGGCTLQEEFVDIRGQKAHTTIQFDSTGQQWNRVVTDPFRTYHSTGKFAPDGSIAFYETPTDRETYRPADHDHVHFIGENSTDGGKSWRVLFDATDTRRP